MTDEYTKLLADKAETIYAHVQDPAWKTALISAYMAGGESGFELGMIEPMVESVNVGYDGGWSDAAERAIKIISDLNSETIETKKLIELIKTKMIKSHQFAKSSCRFYGKLIDDN